MQCCPISGITPQWKSHCHLSAFICHSETRNQTQDRNDGPYDPFPNKSGCPTLGQWQASSAQGCSCSVEVRLSYVCVKSPFVCHRYCINKSLSCRRGSSSPTLCCFSFYFIHVLYTLQALFGGAKTHRMEVNVRFKGFFNMLRKNSLTMQRMSRILAFVFLCLIQLPVSLRIRCQQPLHSRELITEVTGLYNGVKISRLNKSYLLMTRIFFWHSGHIVYTKLFSGQ